MKYLPTMLAYLALSAVGAQAKTINLYWKLIPPSTLRLEKVTSWASTNDIVKTYLGGVLYQTHDNGLHKPDNNPGPVIGKTDWQSCTGCGSGGIPPKHENGPINRGNNVTYEYYYNAAGALTGAFANDAVTGELVAAELYAGGVIVSSYGFQKMEGPLGEDQGTYTVVTTNINNDGVVVIQKYGTTIPFGHVVMMFQKVGTYGIWQPAGSTHTVSAGIAPNSGTNIIYQEDEDLDKIGH